jgi:hypothetical protein
VAVRARAKSKTPAPKQATKSRAPKPASNLITLGLPSLRNRGGRIDEERRDRLRGKRKFVVYREMGDSDSTCGGFLNAVQVFLGKVQGRVKAREVDGVQSPEAEAIAQRFEGAFADMEDTPSEMRAEIVKFACRDGSAPMERTYKICRGDTVKDAEGRPDPMFASDFNDGLIAWRSWSIRPLESVDRWLYDAEKRLRGMVQIADEDYRSREIPIEKLLLFRFRGSKRNPEGDSMFSIAERDYYFKRNFEEYEAIGMERDLAGLPVVEVPADVLHPGASAEKRATFESMRDLATLVRRDALEGVVIPAETASDGKPTGFKFRLMTSGGSRAVNMGDVIKRLRGQISVALGAAFMYAGMDGVGARSLDESKQDVFRLVGASILQAMKEVFDVAICDMARLNNIPQPLWPEYEFDAIDEVSLAEFTTFITGMLAQGGLTYDDELEAEIRAKAGLPARQRDGVVTADTDTGLDIVGAPAPASDAPTVSDVTLTGIQLEKMNELILGVATGRIERSSGLAQLEEGLRMAPAAALRVMGTAGLPGGFVPALEEGTGVDAADTAPATKEDDAPKLTADELRTMMTRAEVKARLRIGDKGLENHVAAGELPEYSIGGRRKYKDSDVHALVTSSVRQTTIDEDAVDRVVEKVAKRRIPRDAGVAQLVALAGVPAEQADALMGEVGRTWFAEATA